MNHISNSDAAWIALAALLPMVLYLLFSAYQTRQRMSVHKAVIDKFSSAEGFAAFLQSAAGQKFVTDLSGSESPARGRHRGDSKRDHPDFAWWRALVGWRLVAGL
jgi:hypothetical protein